MRISALARKATIASTPNSLEKPCPNPCYFRGKRRTTRSRPILSNHLNEAHKQLHMLMFTLVLGNVRSTIKRSGRQIPQLFVSSNVRTTASLGVMTLILISLLVSRRNVTCQRHLCSSVLDIMSLCPCPAGSPTARPLLVMRCWRVLEPQLTFARETCRHSGNAISILPTSRIHGGSANLHSRSRRSPGDPDRLRPCD